MVYCGKLSRACLECRVKRRKCDLAKPSCGQCVRARSVCSGYRDRLALAFRDQSMDVARRVSDNHSKTSIPPNINDLSSIRTRAFQQAAVTHDMKKHLDCALYSGIAFSIEVQAAPFFFHHYLLDETTPSMGDVDCLAVIYGRASARGYLSSIIDAIGIASLSNLQKEPNFMYAASRKYSLALQKVRAGLAEPTEAMSDQMLVAVMLLTLYETVTYDIRHSISSWANHIDGALKLLQLRGIDQLNSNIGRKLCLQLRTEVLIDCLQRNAPVPQVMLNWMSEVQKMETGDETPCSRLANIIVNICALGATTKSCHDAYAVDKPDLSLRISEALSIDADLMKWCANLPPMYNYSTTTMMTDHEDFYLRQYHNYSGLWIAYTWNLYRCARIFLNQILTSLIPHHQLMPFVPTSSSYRSLLDTSNAVIHEGITSIFLSVPFILGHFREEQNPSSDLRAACGLSLLWPLYIAGAACPAQESLRKWAILQLEKIVHTAGVQKAKVIAMMLRRVGIPEDSG